MSQLVPVLGSTALNIRSYKREQNWSICMGKPFYIKSKKWFEPPTTPKKTWWNKNPKPKISKDNGKWINVHGELAGLEFWTYQWLWGWFGLESKKAHRLMINTV